MSCPKHSGEVVIPAGPVGWVQNGNGPSDPIRDINGCELTDAVKPLAKGPWSIYASYASPTVQELTNVANGWRPPAFLELRWSFDSARETVLRAPIPAVGLCLSTPCPPLARVGRYIATVNAVSVRVQAAPGRPVGQWVGVSPSFTPLDGMQAIPEFSMRVQSTGAGPALVTWRDVFGNDLFSQSVADVAHVPPLARYCQFNDVSGSVAFEVIH